MRFRVFVDHFQSLRFLGDSVVDWYWHVGVDYSVYRFLSEFEVEWAR